MAEQPVVMKPKVDPTKVKVAFRLPGQNEPLQKPARNAAASATKVNEGKRSFGQKLTEYAFGEEIEKPGNYIWKSYLEPTGKRVANDIVEHFLQLVKHTFQRWIWHGKILDDGKWMDRTSFSRISSGQTEPIKARVMMSPVKELTFETRADALNVLENLKGIMKEEGGMVTVRDYYETGGQPGLCESGVSSTSGWRNLDKVEVKEQPDGSGWILTLPRPINLKQ